ncbi:hypothetical protein LTR85_002864 [Meristemomyces frigidus]|nr:hypothetical protein LTR85_002864 [Meristemomyces frigidus]
MYNEGPSTHTHNYPPPERADTPPEPTSNVPFRRDPDFVERGDLLDRISAEVSRPAARVAVVGLGGIGKSQLAIEYCYRLREQSRETWVLRIHASSAARFEQGVREIAGLVKIRGRDDPKANIFELVRGWLRGVKSGKWILVLDNVDDASFLLGSGFDNQGTREGSKGSNTLFGYLPVCDHGSILITTRSDDAARELVERSDMITVGAMKDEDALRLLNKKLGDQADLSDTPDLVKELENMPLALTQAAAYLRHMGGRCSARQFVYFRDAPVGAIATRKWLNYENWSTCQVYYPHAQAATELKPKEPQALLNWATVMYNAAWYAQTRVSADDAEKMAVLSLTARTKTLGEGDEETLLSQAVVALAKESQGRWDEAEKLQVQSRIDIAYSDQGRWDEAEKLQVHVMETRKEVLSTEHPDRLTRPSNPSPLRL